MIYASAGQTSAIVPYSVHGKANTKLEVECFGVRSNAVIMQVNVKVPAGSASGSMPVVVVAVGAASSPDTVTLFVK